MLEFDWRLVGDLPETLYTRSPWRAKGLLEHALLVPDSDALKS